MGDSHSFVSSFKIRLLAGKVVELGLASSMSHEGVRKRLKKTFSSRGRSRSGASPR